MQMAALVVATLTLTGVAIIHVAWGMGSSWPFTTGEDLARNVVGDRDRMPDPWMSHGVAGLMLFAVLLLLAAADVIGAPVSETLVNVGAYGVIAVLAIRGIGGLVMSAYLYFVQGDRTPFVRNDIRSFSPLVTVLAVLSYLGSFT
ncbi:hypothetical protein MNBD_ACTINO02-2382 [hydrothermal vent metagenome]|uniref:DUF3995 domain-containing protein n=1 Tax=hydrothermal vent metagenome TaxID=652676 RepID=A0A3B0TK75_9ZZZZ